MNIITRYICPPIPIRKFDWMAYVDGEEEGLRGYGETEKAALKDLLDQIEEGDQ